MDPAENGGTPEARLALAGGGPFGLVGGFTLPDFRDNAIAR